MSFIVYFTCTQNVYCKQTYNCGYFISRKALSIPFSGDLISQFLNVLEVVDYYLSLTYS